MGNLQGNSGLPGSGSQSGVTQSVISPANITIKSGDATSQANAAILTSRDASTANGSLRNTLTLQQAQELQSKLKEQQENQRAADLVGAVVTNAIGDLAAENKRAEGSVENKWAEGSTQKLALHGIAGLIQAKVGGGNALAGISAGMAQEALAPVLASYLEANGIPRKLADGKTTNPDFTALMQAGAAMAGAAVGAVAAGNTAGAATGTSVALTGVTNNYLKHTEIEELLAAQSKCASGDRTACGERDALNALSDRRDTALNACSGQNTSECNGLRQEVLSAQAEIIRMATNTPDTARALEVWQTEKMALSVLSTSDRIGGVTVGVVQATVEGVVVLAQGIATFTRAALGNETARDSVGQTIDSLVRLSDPETLGQVISAATSAQREKLASAYEAGDAFLIGKIGGEILANLPVMPAGSIKTVGMAVKTADQVVVEAAAAAKAANWRGKVAGVADDVARTGRPTPRASEIDIGAELPPGARPQVSFKNGVEVPYGTSGSVRPDWCIGNTCSVEVKNYNIENNSNGLIANVSRQALDRAANLPTGMTQAIVIDVRGQAVTVGTMSSNDRGGVRPHLCRMPE